MKVKWDTTATDNKQKSQQENSRASLLNDLANCLYFTSLKMNTYNKRSEKKSNNNNKEYPQTLFGLN